MGAKAIGLTAAGIKGKPSRERQVREFLGAAGVPELLIDLCRAGIITSAERASCFISYSHTDSAFARKLHTRLLMHGVRSWLAETNLKAGEPIHETVLRALSTADKVLVCCSASSSGSSLWVDREIERAIEKEEESWRKTGQPIYSIIPLDLDGHLFVANTPKVTVLRSRFALTFAGWETDEGLFDAQLAKVVDALVLRDKSLTDEWR
jgi:hypothetical protein